MATYKVLQDIEGEDHLILWLTPKQTIYAAIVIISCALAFVMSRVNILLALPWLLPIVFFGFLAAPLGKDQPNDVWAAAQLRFYLKNRRRIWDQSGMQELVHITVPKRIERIYTDGLDQTEVRSRLKALSTTIDSRGWAVKNSTVNISTAPQFSDQFTQASDDRLLGSESLDQDVPMADVTAADDIMDEVNNSVAQRFDEQIKRQAEQHKQDLIQSLQQGAPQTQAQTTQSPDFYFMNQPDPATVAQQQANVPSAPQLATFSSQVVAPGAPQAVPATQQAAVPDQDAQALLEKIHHDQEIAQDIAQHSRERVLRTPDQIAEDERREAAQLAEANRLAAEAERHRLAEEELARKHAVNTAPDAILKELSRSDLKISTLASQAKHSAEATNENGEVVISLH
jgi:hypothetical protein